MCVVTFDFKQNDATEKFRHHDRTKSLSWVVLEVTESCNFKCEWCYASAKPSDNHMPKERAFKLLELLHASNIKQITFSGGEPLVYPYIKDVIQKANDLGFVIHMNTNGFLLTKELAKELKELGLSQIQTNIDSVNPAVHDKVRGKQYAFQHAVQALRNATDAGMTAVSQTVLTKNNENEIIDIFKLARSLGVQRCRVWDVISCGIAKHNIASRPTNYINTLNELTAFAIKESVENIESGDPCWPLDDIPINTTKAYCPASKNMFTVIDPEGNVIFCAAYREPMYNVFACLDGPSKTSFSTQHTEKLNQFMQERLKSLSSDCKSCRHYLKCLGGCPTRTSEANKDYWCGF